MGSTIETGDVVDRQHKITVRRLQEAIRGNFSVLDLDPENQQNSRKLRREDLKTFEGTKYLKYDEMLPRCAVYVMLV